ncbi:MAG: phosphoribosylanthranilate isomerase [Aquimonas sp.]|nr:phosphoribosylanthranilate isomerase [Aquimonas sp.]
MKRPEDIRAAVALGVDAIGLIVVPGTQRGLSCEQAAVLRREVPVLSTAVLLLMDADAEFAHAAVHAVRPQVLQFHGGESPEFCAAFGLPWIKAVPMGSVQDPMDYQRRYACAAGFVFDSHGAGGQGGSGHGFDWSRLPQERMAPLLLAGGLKPDNVFDAVCAVRPHAVDVSSGIEDAPGYKSLARMQAFVSEVERADRSPAS